MSHADPQTDASTGNELPKKTPGEAWERYSRARRRTQTDETVSADSTAVRWFLQWFDRQDVTHMADLSSWVIEDYFRFVREETDINKKRSLQQHLYTLKNFIAWNEGKTCPEGLAEAIQSEIETINPPRVTEQTGHEPLSVERGEAIRDWLETYRPYSRDHALWVLLLKYGFRTQALRSLDLSHFHEYGEPPNLEFRHRDELHNLTLKNETKSERKVPLDSEAFDVLRGYVEEKRNSKYDDCKGNLCGDGDGCVGTCPQSDLEPLFTTREGRISQSTVQRVVYKLTCPTTSPVFDVECGCSACPDIRESKPSDCERARPPHGVRKCAITRALNREIPKEDVSYWTDATKPVINRHYDSPTEDEKMERTVGSLDRV